MTAHMPCGQPSIESVVDVLQRRGTVQGHCVICERRDFLAGEVLLEVCVEVGDTRSERCNGAGAGAGVTHDLLSLDGRGSADMGDREMDIVLRCLKE